MPSSSKTSTDKLVHFVTSELKKLADPKKAPAMAAYMKTDSGFYGVQKPDRVPIFKEVKKNFKPASRSEYEEAVLALWNLPYREEKYMALAYAAQFVKLATPETMPLFEEIIREGTWWDYVDVVASHLVGNVYLMSRSKIAPIMDAWVEDDDFWIRRTAILSQLKHKKETDEKRLFRYCKARAHEKDSLSARRLAGRSANTAIRRRTQWRSFWLTTRRPSRRSASERAPRIYRSPRNLRQF